MRTKLLFTSLISGLNFEQQIKLQIYPFSLTAMEIFLVFVNIIQQNRHCLGKRRRIFKTHPINVTHVGF